MAQQIKKVSLLATNKKYYWLKLKDDFFTQKEIKRLRKIAGGDTYTIIYLKILLLSLKNEGKIYFDGVGDSFSDELSLELDEEEENIQITLTYLKSKNLLEVVNDEEYFLNDIPSMIGSESDSAVRMRKLRSKKREITSNSDGSTTQSDGKTSHDNNNVQNSDTEIEIDKELDLEKDLNIEKEIKDNAGIETPDPLPYKEIVDYLNQKAGTNYRPSSAKTKTLIKARLNENYSFDDFKKVIDNKVIDANDTKDLFQSKYLRPETLFGTKFESYLNQKQVYKDTNERPTSDYDNFFQEGS